MCKNERDDDPTAGDALSYTINDNYVDDSGDKEGRFTEEENVTRDDAAPGGPANDIIDDSEGFARVPDRSSPDVQRTSSA